MQPPEPPVAELMRRLPVIARNGRRHLALGALLGLAFGVAYLLLADALFVVKALLHVELRESVIRQYQPLSAGSDYVATQAEVIQSPELVAEAIRAIGVPAREEDGLLGTLKRRLKELNPLHHPVTHVDPLAASVRAALPALQASRVLGTDVMAVTFRTDDPERGVRFLGALIDAHRSYVRENETAAHREGLELLRQRKEQLDSQIAEVAARYDGQQADIHSLGEEEGALSVQRMRLEEQARALVDAQRRRIDLENELVALRERSDAQVAPNPEILEEVLRSEATLAELRATLSPRHPDVRQMEQRLAGLRAQLQHGARTRIEELEREVRAARATEKVLGVLYEQEWDRVKLVEAERATVKKLAGEVTRLEEQRGAVLALLGEKELSVLALGSERSGSLVRVLEAPSVPPSAVWPLPIPVLVSCTFVGLLGGLGSALLSYSRRRVRPGADPARVDEAPHRMGQRRASEI
jgi:uncharacterized protein involved in exopolysaccharide biosynthesis